MRKLESLVRNAMSNFRESEGMPPRRLDQVLVSTIPGNLRALLSYGALPGDDCAFENASSFHTTVYARVEASPNTVTPASVVTLSCSGGETRDFLE